MTRKPYSGIRPLADHAMVLILPLIQVAGKPSTVLEDAFLVVSSLASGQNFLLFLRLIAFWPLLQSALEANFAPYVQEFLQPLSPLRKAHEDGQLCTTVVGIIGGISRALGAQSAQCANNVMTILVENLRSEVLKRNVKTSTLSCFGDIGLAIGPGLEPYLNTVMGVLS